MKDRDLRAFLASVPIPDEDEARERAWRVARTAFVQREPVSVPRRRLRPLVALAAGLALVAAALSPPGRAVLDSVREAIGVERAQPALFRLRGSGRLLVNSDAGPWIVSADGSTRWLGRWNEASWSPHGLFVVAARANELAALDPKGIVQWKLARPDPRLPRWGGTRIDTRIAYLSRGALRVVAGDGTGDHTCAGSGVAAVAPAWQPAGRHVLAFADADGRVNVYGVDRCALYWRSAPFAEPRGLVWSYDGKRVLLVTHDRLVLFRWNRREPLAVLRLPGIVDAAAAPHARRFALVRAREVLLVEADRLGARPLRVFAGPGRFSRVEWSPDGRWLLVPWQAADQWVFVRVGGERRIEAVSNVSAQFESGRFPALAGWCCTTTGG